MPEDGARRTLVVSAQDAGNRLDAFLAKRCPDLSRNRIQSELASGAVRVDEAARPKSFRVQEGMTVEFVPAPRPAPRAVAEDIPLDVLYEDEDLAVINKPPGLVVHPAPGHPDGTLVNALLHRWGPLAAGSDPLRPGIVHRLDRDTSGLLVVALNDRSLTELQRQLQERAVHRIYLAVSWGRWAEDEGELTGDIGRDPRRRQRMAVVTRGGRPALTRYRVLADHGFVQLCRVELDTGRTHQIRVHFARGGHPVVGDPLYGDDARVKGVHHLDRRRAHAMVKSARRQLLHAQELRFEHPQDGREMSFCSPPPSDLDRIISELAKGEENG